MATKENKYKYLLSKNILLPAIRDSFVKLNPFALYKNTVIFLVEIGAVLTTTIVVAEIFSKHFSAFNLHSNWDFGITYVITLEVSESKPEPAD